MFIKIYKCIKLFYLESTLMSWKKYGNVYIYDIEVSISELEEEIRKLKTK